MYALIVGCSTHCTLEKNNSYKSRLLLILFRDKNVEKDRDNGTHITNWYSDSIPIKLVRVFHGQMHISLDIWKINWEYSLQWRHYKCNYVPIPTPNKTLNAFKFVFNPFSTKCSDLQKTDMWHVPIRKRTALVWKLSQWEEEPQSEGQGAMMRLSDILVSVPGSY